MDGRPADVPATLTPGDPGQEGSYYPALDGLRALSVAAVLAYHANSLRLAGGFLGVEVFFVLSGFVITTLLVREWGRTGAIDLGAFWRRRLRRLLPGMVTVTLAAWAAVLAAFPDEVRKTAEDVLPGLGFASNWTYILHARSYFDAAGRPRLLEHLWSLAVEFQYYLVWPFACALLLKAGRRAATLVCVIGALASTGLMACLFVPGQDPSRLYFGTDTRASGLLIGSALAFALPAAVRVWSRVGRLLLDLGGLAALLGLAAAGALLDQTRDGLYQGGFAGVALLAALCIAAVVANERGAAARLLGLPLLRAVGLRAYSLYLWHWPVFNLLQPWVDVRADGLKLLALRLGLTVILSEASYRWIDTPIRRGELGRVLRRPARTWGAFAARAALLTALASAACALGLAPLLARNGGMAHASLARDQAALLDADGVGAAGAGGDRAAAGVAGRGDIVFDIEGPVQGCGGAVVEAPHLVFVEAGDPAEDPAARAPAKEPPPPDALPAVAGTEGNSASSPAVAATEEPAPANTAKEAQDAAAATQSGESGEPALTPPLPKAAADSASPDRPDAYLIRIERSSASPEGYISRIRSADEKRRRCLAIGDSVMLATATSLVRAIGDINIDTKVGRQLGAAKALVAEYKKKDLLGDVVILHLGNNGPFNRMQLMELMRALKDVPTVLLLNLKLPLPYEEANNALLAEASRSYPNVRLVDWRGVSAEVQKYFAADGVHLTRAGVRCYTRVVANAVCAAGT